MHINDLKKLTVTIDGQDVERNVFKANRDKGEPNDGDIILISMISQKQSEASKKDGTVYTKFGELGGFGRGEQIGDVMIKAKCYPTASNTSKKSNMC